MNVQRISRTVSPRTGRDIETLLVVVRVVLQLVAGLYGVSRRACPLHSGIHWVTFVEVVVCRIEEEVLEVEVSSYDRLSGSEAIMCAPGRSRGGYVEARQGKARCDSLRKGLAVCM